jgi:NitT/TauT family transport system substrate-binding protein
MARTPTLTALATVPKRLLLAAALCFCSLLSAPSFAKDDYRIAWSIYVGWMPWDYAARSGIVDKWAEKYGITIEVVQFNDYIESINQYTVGAFDGCTMTNMDALTIPAAGGVDSTALIVGDFSNGNDGIVLKGAGKSLADIKGQNVNLVELSVSHYLLARALAGADMTERDLTVVNTSDADIVAAFATDDVTSVVTWNPLLAEIKAMPEVSPVFDSSMLPGEIIDMLVVSTEALEDPRFGKALAGAWYETMAVMSGAGDAAEAAKTQMAEASGTDLAGYNAQLAATQMFYEPDP